MEKMLLSFQEAKNTLNIGHATLYELIRRGEVGSAKIGKRRLFEPDALRSYIERQKQVAH